jgi:predicted dehydrogenase
LRAVAESGLGQIVALADVNPDSVEAARAVAPDALAVTKFDDLLELDVDGVVIATPTASHAAQSLQALASGRAVFCQKPLAGNAADAAAVVDQARAADRLLGVDLSYRFVRAMQTVRQLVVEGALGNVFAMELTFHNAYGPDKPWYYDRALAGGGCLMDLGIHLVDQLLWICDANFQPSVLSARLFEAGHAWTGAGIEDFAIAHLQIGPALTATVTCSWRAPAGADAAIEVTAFGTDAGARARNVNGSFYDFVAERLDRGHATTLCEPPDAWGGRAIVEWVRALAAGARFDPKGEEQVALARLLDDIYRAARAPAGAPAINPSSTAARCAAV